MIKVTVGNNVNRKPVFCEPEDTIRTAILKAKEQYGLDISSSTSITLDGGTIGPGEINKTFAELGYSNEEPRNACSIIAVVKADNA